MKRHRNHRSAGFTLADLCVVMVLIPLAGALFMGCYERRYDGSNRVKCSANLKAIGQALLLYANDIKGQYPMAGYKPGPEVVPTWGTAAPEPNDVSAAIFLLINTQELTAEMFVCPMSQAEMWDYGGGVKTSHDWKNWEGRDGIRKHLSYSMQNPYADGNAIKRGFQWNSSLPADYAVAADINPGTSGSGENVLTVTPESSAEQMRQGNSPNHDYMGQNILFGDGHVDWAPTPFAGPGGDNIYARRDGPTGSKSSEVRASPYDGTDNVLLPTND